MPDSMDWVKANVRSCDVCGRETDAGQWPDWPNGICEDCDPDILLDFFDCDGCKQTLPIGYAKAIRVADRYSWLLCHYCWLKVKEQENA